MVSFKQLFEAQRGQIIQYFTKKAKINVGIFQKMKTDLCSRTLFFPSFSLQKNPFHDPQEWSDPLVLSKQLDCVQISSTPTSYNVKKRLIHQNAISQNIINPEYFRKTSFTCNTLDLAENASVHLPKWNIECRQFYVAVSLLI